MNIKRYSVDRINDGIITLVGDDGTILKIKSAEYELLVNDIVDIEFSGESILSVRKNEAEKQKRLRANSALFNSLFKKKG